MLFCAAEGVLDRDGASGLTSRAVTMEAGVAKGVMYRHFADFDGFLAELILDRVAQLEGPAEKLRAAAGAGTVVDNLTDALTAVFSPLAVAMVALVISRDGLRARLRQAGAPRFPLIAEGCAMVAEYLAAEQSLGRVADSTDIPTLSHMLVGALHLLFTERDGGPPEAAAIRQVVMEALHGAAGDDNTRPSFVA